jgi:hypothetical protein
MHGGNAVVDLSVRRRTSAWPVRRLSIVALLDEAKKSANAIRVGDYLQAGGEKVHQYLFEAYDVDID